MNKDSLSTAAGSGAGFAMLLTVKWEAIPQGELVKIGVAVLLIVMGYVFYKNKTT
jgi:uncharacterized membrane protein YebE (DUF533 family)